MRIDFRRFIQQLEGEPAAPGQPQWLRTETPSIDLAHQIHLPDGAFEGLLIFYHGGAAHGRAGYDRMAQRLVEAAPIAVCLPDIRGHGASGGKRGHAAAPVRVWDDVDRLVAAMREQFPEMRIHLGGHSSGAGMLLNHLTRRPPQTQADSLILLAPELGWRAGLYHNGSRFGSFARVRIWPFMLAALSGELFGNGIPAVHFDLPTEALDAPGLVSHYTVGMANALTPDNPARQLQRLTIPTHIGIAGSDQLINADRLAAFITQQKNPNIHVTRLADTDHLGAILDAAPFIQAALGFGSMRP